ncbi:phosphoribosylformylglycinamidine synthase [Cyclobacterium lianum]|uniref:Phosphoribosylformylglycinamidine synthase n=1 Tax=Cyclobacterium lianum TaxID=388280 RepID=A0A1M7P8U8_9BACT|nr:phosphoribosylformylglycinamidine synthase [Cyclobacterium lianum]SHN12652.1 phosphoribosylformylglycinamidine synthase [Cyclobacterium lianum]
MKIIFFQSADKTIYALQTRLELKEEALQKLSWLFGAATWLNQNSLVGEFVGPRKEMVTPWSTNAVEICENMGISGVLRIEFFLPWTSGSTLDPMLQRKYDRLDQDLFYIDKMPDPILLIQDIAAYNEKEGLALSKEEINYLEGISKAMERPLTDSEVFGFSQVNSEHCRHKIFNGTFVIDGEEKPFSLFQLIKKTAQTHPNAIVSAYKDNVAFVKGPKALQFAPETQDKSDFFGQKEIETVLSLKAETHNFPTTVEPFNGAATGSGGEIRDRMAGGTASIPLAGTAVYMTSYPRTAPDREWEKAPEPRKWLYQSPAEILIKASNGASDFGNKFGQPLICGSLLTFEHEEQGKNWGFDKVIMLAGGIGFTRAPYSLKKSPTKDNSIVLMGGDNYRIGMGGSAVSSLNTGELSNALELNAIQRSNPEMQKRVANVIRAMAESEDNPIISIHDHGAGGHLNCLSELVEETGGTIHLDKLPVGDPTLSAREIIGNESQERMGLVLEKSKLDKIRNIASRERAPFYEIGETTGDLHFKFENGQTGEKPIDWSLNHMFGSSPRTILEDQKLNPDFAPLSYERDQIEEYLNQVLQLEAVACKDWLTNKVDRSVTGRVAKQQSTGPLQLPLNNVAVMAMDYSGNKGIATSIGHAPVAALANPEAGSRLAIAEALTNLVWAPLNGGLKAVSLSANWMWPAKNPGENDRLYRAVAAASDFAIQLGINIPTGKDSLSMTQKYPNGKTVYAPGTVIISTVGECDDIRKVLSPAIKPVSGSTLLYIDFSSDKYGLGGSSFAQVLHKIGLDTPDIKDEIYFAKAFEAIQELIHQGKILAGHDISSGGLISTLLEMCFPNEHSGLTIHLENHPEKDPVKALFAENPGIVIQVASEADTAAFLKKRGISYCPIASVQDTGKIVVRAIEKTWDMATLRDTWYRSSYLLDQQQSGKELALNRFENYKKQPLRFIFPEHWKGSYGSLDIDPIRTKRSGIRAAIIREKGVNGDREMAYSLWLAGFDVKDVHMTDLISGKENLEDVNMIVFVGGFSNSDVLGSAKGWAGAFLYNEKAKKALDSFYARKDTLSLGVCNGCQLMVALDLVNPEHKQKTKMLHNDSHKFESAFVNVSIPENKSVMLGSLSGLRLGVWVAHGEGKFCLPMEKSSYHIGMTYSYESYPGNPNGSDHGVAGLASSDGRHLAIMPHIERSLSTWNWPYFPEGEQSGPLSPWILAFVNARNWVKAQQ